MEVVIRAFVPGNTAALLEGYDATAAPHDPERILHICTGTDAGIEIVEVWEAEQALHRFLTEVLPGIWDGVGMAERMTGTPSWTIAPVHSWSVRPLPIADAAAPGATER